MKDRETNIVGNWESGGAMLQCEREQCMTRDSRGAWFWWQEDLPFKALPDEIREAYDRHLATHEGGAP